MTARETAGHGAAASTRKGSLHECQPLAALAARALAGTDTNTLLAPAPKPRLVVTPAPNRRLQYMIV